MDEDKIEQELALIACITDTEDEEIKEDFLEMHEHLDEY